MFPAKGKEVTLQNLTDKRQPLGLQSKFHNFKLKSIHS